MRKYSCHVKEAKADVSARTPTDAVKKNPILTPLRLTMPGASRVAPTYSRGQAVSISHSSMNPMHAGDQRRTKVGRVLTVENANLGSDIVVICIQSRDLEVLVVIGRVQEVGGLCGCSNVCEMPDIVFRLSLDSGKA